MRGAHQQVASHCGLHPRTACCSILIAVCILGAASTAAGGPALFRSATRAFATGYFPYVAAIGDLNGDGRPDLAVTNSLDNTVSVLLGVGTSWLNPR